MRNGTQYLILSCEHGGNRVPAEYASLFRRARKALESHRGYDPGSLEIGRFFAQRMNAPLHASKVTRLLVELNRSLGHPAMFSEFTSRLEPSARAALLDKFYYPHRRLVEKNVADAVGSGQPVVHLSLHTFTPGMNSQVRNADIGLLYDPSRPGEKRFCERWRKILIAARGELRVRRNYPYLGRADGFTTYFRKRFHDREYIGIELEVNQSWFHGDRAKWRRLIGDVADSFAEVRASFNNA